MGGILSLRIYPVVIHERSYFGHVTNIRNAYELHFHANRVFLCVRRRGGLSLPYCIQNNEFANFIRLLQEAQK